MWAPKYCRIIPNSTHLINGIGILLGSMNFFPSYLLTDVRAGLLDYFDCTWLMSTLESLYLRVCEANRYTQYHRYYNMYYHVWTSQLRHPKCQHRTRHSVSHGHNFLHAGLLQGGLLILPVPQDIDLFIHFSCIWAAIGPTRYRCCAVTLLIIYNSKLF